MTKYNLTLYSKNQEALNHLLKFIKHSNEKQNFQILTNLLKQKRKKKKISVLKSPHVNKTAQEQFKYIYYSIKMSFYSWEIKKYLILIKNIKNQLFPDIRIKITTTFSQTPPKNKFIHLNKVSFYYPILADKNQKSTLKKLKSNVQFFKNKNLLKNTLFYLKLLDYSGEL